jgi:hypothetical protein
MEITAVVPDWITWIVAAGMGALAIAALTRTFEVVFDLDRG